MNGNYFLMLEVWGISKTFFLKIQVGSDAKGLILDLTRNIGSKIWSLKLHIDFESRIRGNMEKQIGLNGQYFPLKWNKR